MGVRPMILVRAFGGVTPQLAPRSNVQHYPRECLFSLYNRPTMDATPPQESELVPSSPALAELPALVLSPPPPGPRNPARVYLARLAPGSRRTMAGALHAIAGLLIPGASLDTLPWWQLSYPYTQAVRAAIGARWAMSTANKTLAALRGVLKECWRLGLLESDAYQRAADLPSFRGTRLLRGRALSAGEVRALFASCAAAENGRLGARDAALLAVLYGGALRRSEAVALDVADYNTETGEVKVRSGKGNQQRVVPLPRGSRAALEAWLEARGDVPGPLFMGVTKGGALASRRLTADAVREMCGARARKAGIQGFSPHDLRRSSISDLLDAGADIVAIQKVAGHANIHTTARYDRRDEKVKRKAVELLHVPFNS